MFPQIKRYLPRSHLLDYEGEIISYNIVYNTGFSISRLMSLLSNRWENFLLLIINWTRCSFAENEFSMSHLQYGI